MSHFSGLVVLTVSILFTEDWIDLYSSRCMSDPNLMALALTVPKKHG